MNIVYTYGDKFYNDLSEEFSAKTIQTICVQRVFDKFIHEKLLFYDQLPEIKDGVLMAITQEFGYIFRNEIECGFEYEDALIKQINLYFDHFNITDYIDTTIEYAVALLDEDNNSYHKRLLYSAAFDALVNNDKSTQFVLYVNAIINDYYFTIIMPREDEAIKAERIRIINNIPDFSEVHEGQQWTGIKRKADFIRALKLEPKPAGKNSRIAQEKSIAQSCYFDDDADKKVLTLQQIFEERRPKDRAVRQKKYASCFTILLLNTLQKCEKGILHTTKPNLLKDIKAIPSVYKKIPKEFYMDIFPPELNNEHETDQDLKQFHKITKDRFNEIIEPILEDLALKSIIKYQTYPVVVTANKVHISIFDSEELGLQPGELAKMMLKAEQEAASKIQIQAYDPVSKKYLTRSLKNLSDVQKYRKLSEYKIN